jgi:hypothetical protein
MKTLLLFAALSLSGCRQGSTTKTVVDEPVFKKPTATEIFNLRSKCADFGQKIKNGNVVKVGLTQDQVSHYDPKTNRCFVELTVTTADLMHIGDYLARYCYDGQTGEILAWSKTEKGVMIGWVLGASLGIDDFVAATTKIDALMADDRKQ